MESKGFEAVAHQRFGVESPPQGGEENCSADTTKAGPFWFGFTGELGCFGEGKVFSSLVEQSDEAQLALCHWRWHLWAL